MVVSVDWPEHAANTYHLRNHFPHPRSVVAVAIAIAIRPLARRYPHRTRKFQLSFSADDRVGCFRRIDIDSVVVAKVNH